MSEFVPFRFYVSLAKANDDKEILCRGAFSEVSGLEVTMEPKVIVEGGRNWGEFQRSGPAKFSPIVLKRGVTSLNDLWSWMDATSRGLNYGYRLTGSISVLSSGAETFPADAAKKKEDKTKATETKKSSQPLLTWKLQQVLPTKFKGPDLSSTASQVAIEELHLVHEGLELVRAPEPKAAADTPPAGGAR